LSKDRTGQVWELYAFGGDGWVCLITAEPLKERGRGGFTLHPTACLKAPSDVTNVSECIPQSEDGAPVLEEDDSSPWEQNKLMTRLL